MELGNRKNEAKNELKRQDIVIEVGYPRSVPFLYSRIPSPCTTGRRGRWVILGQKSRRRNGTTCANQLVSHMDICGTVTDSNLPQLLFRVSLSLSSWAWSSPLSRDRRNRKPSKRPRLNHGIGLRAPLPSLNTPSMKELDNPSNQLEIYPARSPLPPPIAYQYGILRIIHLNYLPLASPTPPQHRSLPGLPCLSLSSSLVWTQV